MVAVLLLTKQTRAFQLTYNAERLVIYVADLENNRVQVFDVNGQYLFKFRGKYTDSEEGFRPLSLSVSDEGSLYVLDSNSNVLSVFEIKYKE